MASQRHEISLRVLKNISRVSAPFELFYDKFKVTKCCTKTLFISDTKNVSQKGVSSLIVEVFRPLVL